MYILIASSLYVIEIQTVQADDAHTARVTGCVEFDIPPQEAKHCCQRIMTTISFKTGLTLILTTRNKNADCIMIGDNKY